MEFFDRQGQPITMKQLFEFQTHEYIHVRVTRMKRWFVSTVWIGGPGQSNIFETIIFDSKSEEIPLIRRCATEKQALRNHSDTCRMIHSGWRG